MPAEPLPDRGLPGTSTPAQRRRSPRATDIAREDVPLLLSSVFFTFAPTGVLLMMIQDPPRTWSTGLAAAVLSGVIAMGWAYSFSARRYWIISILVVGQFFVPRAYFLLLGSTGMLDIGSGLSSGATRLFLSIEAVVFIILGYILGLRFMGRFQQRATRYRSEIELGARIHQSLVPDLARSGSPVELLGRSTPSNQMGGDLIDSVEHNGIVDVMLADVSGHGVGAGLVMGMVKGAVRTRLLAGGELGQVAADINRVLTELTRPEMFVTAAFLRFHPLGKLEYTLAGHPPIILVRSDGTVETLENEALPMGIDAGETFRMRSVQLRPADLLSTMTDGLTESKDSAGRMLGMDPIVRLMVRERSLALSAIHDLIMAEVSGHGPQEDDRSLVLMRAM